MSCKINNPIVDEVLTELDIQKLETKYNFSHLSRTGQGSAAASPFEFDKVFLPNVRYNYDKVHETILKDLHKAKIIVKDERPRLDTLISLYSKFRFTEGNLSSMLDLEKVIFTNRPLYNRTLEDTGYKILGNNFSGRSYIALENDESNAPILNLLDIAETILHEHIHTLSFNLINDLDSAASKQIYAMHEAALQYARDKNIDPETHYGLTNPKEFIAEALSNIKFRDFLNDIPYNPVEAQKKNSTLLQVFIDLFISLFFKGSDPKDLKTLLNSVDAINIPYLRETSPKETVKSFSVYHFNPTITLMNLGDEGRFVTINGDQSVKDVQRLVDNFFKDPEITSFNPEFEYDKSVSIYENMDRFLDQILEKDGEIAYDELEKYVADEYNVGFYNKSYMIYLADKKQTKTLATEEKLKGDNKVVPNIELSNVGWKKNEDQYDNSVIGKTIPSVTSTKPEGGLGRFFSKMFDFGKRDAMERAKAYWGNNDPNEKLMTNRSAEPITLAQYADLIETHDKMGLFKGNIIHKYIQIIFEKDPDKKKQFTEELINLYTVSGYKEKYFRWIIDNMPTIAGSTMLGVQLKTTYDEDGKPIDYEIDPDEEVQSELVVVSEELNMAGTLDLLVRYADGTYSIKDIKTGANMRNFAAAALFKYGNQGVGSEFLTNTSMNRAKLQVMLYALMLKSNNLDMKFRDLAVLWLPSQEVLRSPNKAKRKVQVAAYLGMIRQYLENEDPKAVAALKAKHGELGYQKLFDPAEYDNGIPAKLRKEMDEAGEDSRDTLRRKTEELKHYISYDLNPLAFRFDQNKATVNNRIKELMKEILDLQSKVRNMNITDWQEDISWLSLWLSSPSTVNSPYIQLYNTLLKEAKAKFNMEYQSYYNKFRALLLPLYNSYMVSSGRAPVKALTGNYMNFIDTRKFYGPMIMGVVDPNTKEVIDYKYRTTPQEWAEARNQYPNVTEEQWKMYQNLAEYVNNTIGGFFKSPDSYLNQVAVYKTINYKGEFDKPLTHLDLHNQNGNPYTFKWGFMPKVPTDLNELGSFFTSARYRKEMWHRMATLKIENDFEAQNREDVALPIKYLGNPTMNNDPLAFSFNVEKQFDLFVRNVIYKKNFDSVYAIAQGMRLFLKGGNVDENFYQNTIDYLQYSAELHLRGRTQVTKGINKFKQKSPVTFDIPKFISSIRNFAVSPIMWFNYKGGTANGIFTMMYLHKEGLKNSILKGNKFPILGGVDKDSIDFGFEDIKDAWGEVVSMYTEQMRTGTIRNSKTYLLLQQLGYMPDSWDFATSKESMLTTYNKAISTSSAYLFYSLPEEMVAAITMVAQLKSMKIRGGDKEFSGKSLWDMYELIKLTDENGKEFSDVRWKIDPKTNKPYVRYYKKVVLDANTFGGAVPKTEYHEITGLEPEEVSRLYFVYERMQGGYRKEEKSLIDYFFIGQIFMQLRRYLPNILRNAGMSAGLRPVVGKFEQVGDETKGGKKVVQWQSQLMEGRWNTLFNVLFYPLVGGLIKKILPNDNRDERTAFENFVYKYVRTKGVDVSYKWENLSPQQREAVADAAITFTLFLTMAFTSMLMFGSDIDDDDPWFKFAKRIREDFSQQYNIMELSKNLSSTSPVAFKKMYDFMVHGFIVGHSMFAYTLGNEEAAFTKEGRLRGWTQWQNDIPIISAIRRYVSGMENLDPDWSKRGWYTDQSNDLIMRIFSE